MQPTLAAPIVRGRRKARKSSQRSRTRVKFLQGQIFSPVLHFPTIRAASSGPLRGLARVKFFFSVLGYGTILHGVKFFRALSFFTSTEFPGVVFPQYISRGAQLRHEFLKNCTTRNEVFSYLTQEGPQEMYYDEMVSEIPSHFPVNMHF